MNTVAKWAIAVLLISPCSAFGGPIAYSLGFTISNGEYSEFITGELITDGTTGFISASNVIGGRIIDSLGTFTFSAGGVSQIGGELNVVATPTRLGFNAYMLAGQCLQTNACGFQITSTNDPKQYINLAQAGEPNFLEVSSDTHDEGYYTTICCITLSTLAQPYAPVAGKFSGLVYNRSTQSFNSILTLTNTGPLPVQSPLAIQIATGTSAVTVAGTSDGATYVANLPGGSLAPGASAQMIVAFADPTRVGFVPSITATVMSDATSTKLIGSAGGSLAVTNHLGDILTVTIPPLALDQDTMISASALTSLLPNTIAKNLYPGAILQPEGLLFNKPVGISITPHGALDNPNLSLLFWPKNRDLGLSLPLANQSTVQGTIAGQSYHFSTVIAAEPTPQELAALQIAINTNPLGSVTQVIDVAGSELQISATCQLVSSECGYGSWARAQKLISDEAAALLKAAQTNPPSNPCGMYTVQVGEILVLGQQLGLDDTVAPLLSLVCKYSVRPESLMFNLGAAPQTLVASFSMPDGETPYFCVAISWFATDATIAAVNPICNGANYLSCPVSPVGLGVTQVSVGCDHMVTSAQVSVCSATGIWGGTYSNGQGDSGDLYATMSETNGSVAASFNGFYITGTDDDGSVLFGPVTWSGQNGGFHEAYASGEFSSDCNTISGGWVKTKKDKTRFGSFNLLKLPGS
ncbi:MAG: hypothetical protein ACHQIL_07635 [Steroidobacterales bacterium]